MNQYFDVVSFNQYIGWYRDVNESLHALRLVEMTTPR